jgi:hypothetical protein
MLRPIKNRWNLAKVAAIFFFAIYTPVFLYAMALAIWSLF